jgi:hypothetical protein
MLRPRIPDPIGYQHAAARLVAVLVDVATLAVLIYGVLAWNEDPSINGPGFAAVSFTLASPHFRLHLLSHATDASLGCLCFGDRCLGASSLDQLTNPDETSMGAVPIRG